MGNITTAIYRFLGSAGIVLVLMGIFAVWETFASFHRKNADRDRRRRHLEGNLGLTVVTLVLNFALTSIFVFIAPNTKPSALAAIDIERLFPSSPFLVTCVAIVVLDFATYVAHRSMHCIPLMWRAHRVHHLDPLVDVTTTLRQHPLEGMWRFLFIAGPALLLGIPASSLAIYRFISVVVALLEHVNIRMWQPLDTLLSFVFTTPNMHKLHHSKDVRETDSNYGNIFSIFDRLFGTFTPTVRSADLREYGLNGYDDDGCGTQQRLGSLLRLPFRR
jgi:sterol desaturase/sphingolipid hydroxylase (fatty acid hydroxylase superfamily)